MEAAAQREQQFQRAQVMPQARRLIEDGNLDGARTLLEGAGLTPQQINGVVRGAVNPARNQVRMQRGFNRAATPLGWSLTLLAGLALATPFAVWSSRTALGRAARRLGLFLTEDEVAPDPVLRAYQRAMTGSLPHSSGGGWQPHLAALQAVERD